VARRPVRTARPLNWSPLGWMLIGAIIAALVILGPRVAVNRALDAGYSLSARISRLV
jgi:hypothetical protein